MQRDSLPRDFLASHWQKQPYFVRRGIETVAPVLSADELAWLATQDDVESRLVLTDTVDGATCYRLETGPFPDAQLSALPERNWTLLVQDVDKHLPDFRDHFAPFACVPDWRIDDLMISFAAPGGGVGPHRDNYDVFLCQGIGVREWRISMEDIPEDTLASDDLALLQEFNGGDRHVARRGDVLYLPPGVAHWGTAQRACITYSIGMRAPPYYADPDLLLEEVRPGYISPAARERAGSHANRLGCSVTELKQWLQPLAPSQDEITALLGTPTLLRKLRLHGMARLAYDDDRLYLNGIGRRLEDGERKSIAALCIRRRMDTALAAAFSEKSLRWLLDHGAFEIPEF